MKESKIQISAKVLDALADSQVINDTEKMNFLKYVGYLTYNEQKELMTLV